MQGTAFIRVEGGFYDGLEWPLDRSSTIVGRGGNADLVLSEATISRAHAQFSICGDQVFVKDLGSTNGTMINGVSGQQSALCDRDEIKMGRLVLRLVLPEGEAARD